MPPLCFLCPNLYKLSKDCKGCNFEIVFQNKKRIIRVKEVVESVGWFDSCIGRDRLTTAPSYQMPVCCLLLNRTAFGFADIEQELLKLHLFPSPECNNSCLGQWPHLKIQPCCESIKSEGCRCPKLAAMVHLQWHLKKVENVTYVRIIPIWRQVWKHTFAISPTRPVHQIGHSSPSTIGAGYSTAVEGSGELFTRVEFHFFLLLPCPLPWGDFEITTNTKILIAGNV